MDSASTVALIVGVLTFISGIASLIISRRKLNAESQSINADAFEKFQSTLTKLQERNDALYQENVTMQVAGTSDARTIYTLTNRLEERDSQLASATRQLDLLREMARTAPITETLQVQLAAMNTIVRNMQAAEVETKHLLNSREAAYKELFSSTQELLKAEKARRIE